MTKTINSGSKVVRTLVALAFAIGFGVAGWYAGWQPVSAMLAGWWRAQNLVAVSAQILELSLDERVDESLTWQVKAEFVYHYQGKEFRSHRINIAGDTHDNIGNYQQACYQQLLQSKSQGQGVTLWADPKNPQFAVLDRQPRFRLLLFSLPFALLFPMISLLACWGVWRIWHEVPNRTLAPDHARQSARGGAQFASHTTLVPDTGAAYGMALFAVIWSLMSFAIAVPLFLQKWESKKLALDWYYLSLLFPLVGVLLISFAALNAYRRWRLGKTSLLMVQQAATGRTDIRMRLQFATALGTRLQASQLHYPLTIQFQCAQKDKRNEDAVEKVLWSQKQAVKIAMHGAQHFDFTIDCPAGLPASGMQDNDALQVIWTLQVKLLGYTLDFIIPVHHTAHSAPDQQLSHRSAASLKRDAASSEKNAGSSRGSFVFMGPHKVVSSPGTRTARWVILSIIVLTLMLTSVFAYLSSLHAEDDDAQAGLTDRPLIAPAQKETLTRLQARLKAGADVNARDGDGKTLLMHAALDADLPSVQFLLEHGAQVNAATPLDATGLGERTALFDAIQADALPVLQALVAAGANIHQASNQVWTPMHYGAYRGAVKSMAFLQTQGLPVDERFSGARGSTPLMIAVEHDQVDSIRFLISAGADKNKKDLYGEDACSYARYFKKPLAAKTLGCD
ncbi:ankyrin repeat domain-containing protein [Undibacterium sp. TJN19]|uniref:ankyrin repeat domain-containing protein n=1 Tax=Undibacterium sp. TJN19 TaxID=3413055 RepID=UPI003BEFDF58